MMIPERHGRIWSIFFGICGINDLESRLEVIQGRWYWHQQKARVWLPVGPQY